MFVPITLKMRTIKLIVSFVILSSCESKTSLLSYVDRRYFAAFNNSLTNENISEECSSQLQVLHDGLMAAQLWAWQMLDAHGKLPSGVLFGNYYDLGNYDECLSVKTENISGKYCLGTITPPTFASVGNDPEFLGLHLGVCLPVKCTAADAEKIYPLEMFSEKYCYSEDTLPRLDAEAIVTIAILSSFCLLALLSTSYDVFLYYTGRKAVHDITIAFSFLTNGKKLITPSRDSDQLLCLHGIKAITMMWIIMGHEYSNGLSGAITNYFTILQYLQDIGHMFVVESTVAVDTFLVVGGLVVVYSFLKSADKGVKFNIVLFYVHRYIRLTPALAVVVLIHATLLKQLGDGPLWNAFDDHLVAPCRKHYWAAMLYIQNYVHDAQACVPQTWYLSVDMQLFVLSPLILVPLKRKPKRTLIGLSVLAIAGVVGPFFIAYYNRISAFLISPNMNDAQQFIFLYYAQTYGRFAPYVIGMILGYYIYKIREGQMRVTIKPIIASFLWVACLSGGLACVYAGHDTMLAEYDKWSHSFYIAFNRPSWSLAVGGIIFLCVSGNGGAVNAFLSAPIFQCLSKISYAVYLVHYEFILVRASSYKTEIVAEDFYVFFNYCGDFMFSVALAVLLCLIFESPMITIEKILFSKRLTKQGTKTVLNV